MHDELICRQDQVLDACLDGTRGLCIDHRARPCLREQLPFVGMPFGIGKRSVQAGCCLGTANERERFPGAKRGPKEARVQMIV